MIHAYSDVYLNSVMHNLAALFDIAINAEGMNPDVFADMFVPDRRQDYYIAYSRHGHYELHMDGPVRPERMVLIGDRSLATILEQLMEDECLVCFRDGDEIGKCPLRQVMLEVAVPNELEDGRWRKCEYREAARQLLKGENVTI